MPGVLHYALLADGPSDAALLPILRWHLQRVAPRVAVAEPGFVARRPAAPIADEVDRATGLFQANLLFVHRDAENRDPGLRRAEIPDRERVVKVVPVRMTEAWLLFDETAIRRAADHPNGRVQLDLPGVPRLEEIADPKARLREALLAAAEVTGRQRKRFLLALVARIHRLADVITDYSPLLRLPAFCRLADDVAAALQRLTVE